MIRRGLFDDVIKREPELKSISNFTSKDPKRGNNFVTVCAKFNYYDIARYLLYIEETFILQLVRNKTSFLRIPQNAGSANLLSPVNAANPFTTSRTSFTSNKMAAEPVPGLSSAGGTFLPNLNFTNLFHASLQNQSPLHNSIIYQSNHLGYLPLHFAVSFFNRYQPETVEQSVLSLLVDYDLKYTGKNHIPRSIHAGDENYGLTPLHYGLLRRNSDGAIALIEKLVNSGLSPFDRDSHINYLLTATDNTKRNAFHYAAEFGCDTALDKMLSLLDKFKIQPANALLKQLTSQNNNKKKTRYGRSISSHVLSVKEILKLEDQNNFTPLHLAVYREHTKCVEIILKYGTKDQLFKEDRTGRLPIDLAITMNNIEMVKILLDSVEKESDVQEAKDIKSNEKRHSIAKDTSTTFKNVYKQFLNFSQNKHLLLEQWYLAAKENVQLVKLLVETYKADLSKVDAEGNSALIIAAKFNKPNVLKYLLNQHKDKIQIDAANNHQNTALHCAAVEGNQELGRFLLFF